MADTSTVASRAGSGPKTNTPTLSVRVIGGPFRKPSFEDEMASPLHLIEPAITQDHYTGTLNRGRLLTAFLPLETSHFKDVNEVCVEANAQRKRQHA